MKTLLVGFFPSNNNNTRSLGYVDGNGPVGRLAALVSAGPSGLRLLPLLSGESVETVVRARASSAAIKEP
jgi:hypothetical protein